MYERWIRLGVKSWDDRLVEEVRADEVDGGGGISGGKIGPNDETAKKKVFDSVDENKKVILKLVSLVSWCVRPSEPQRIISGLRETFIKRYIAQRTSKAEQDQKNRVRKRRVVERIYGTKYS